ncbi:hypothetical protein BUALT_Bualt15G0086300 [Buddleja alternifolia]|uniref:ZF-HD dimerization-type domain-containing protein n=1 Tax=Buddleja alternifolia TaxID=168488 RepID=A0AAV6WDY5_9LAMI|nr:hypothetical protein BUALT_Bualt15G0086300 [Buddleja alternifolia]
MASTNSIHGARVEMVVLHKECLHSHAVQTMGHFIDGCGLFEASGQNGTPESYGHGDTCRSAYLESNNWKLFRHYSKEEIAGVSSEIGMTRMALKNWINSQTRKRQYAYGSTS